MNNFFKMQFYSGLLLKLKNKCKHLYISTIKKKGNNNFFFYHGISISEK
jgi:hypothetical protein